MTKNTHSNPSFTQFLTTIRNILIYSIAEIDKETLNKKEGILHWENLPNRRSTSTNPIRIQTGMGTNRNERNQSNSISLFKV